MEKDLMELKQKVLEFCKKYKVSLNLDTVVYGRNENGEVQPAYITSKILD